MSADVKLSMHAVDRASSRLLELYLEERQEDEGIVSWLEAIVREAVQLEPVERTGGALIYELGRVRIVVRHDTVVTVTPARPAGRNRRLEGPRWHRALQGLSGVLRRER